ncbi:permease [Paenibacillus marinisediminis]
MLYKPFGIAGFILIVGTMAMRSLDVTHNLTILGIIALAGLFCFGIAENQFGKRHWLVKYIDYAPLVVFGFLFAVQMRDHMTSIWYAAAIIPLSALSGWEANRMARKEKYRTMKRIEEMLPKQPTEHKHH